MAIHSRGVLDPSEHYFLRASAFALDHLYYALSAGRFTVNTDYQVTRLNYSKFLLMYVEEGRLSCQNDSRVGTASAGDLLLLDCTRPHLYFALTDARFSFIHFDGGESGALCKWLLSRETPVIHPRKAQEYSSAFDRLLDLARERHMDRETRMSAEIYHLLMLLCSDASARGTDADARDLADRAISYIGAHLSENLSLDSLAEMFGYSPGYFSRAFRRQTGLSPYQFITRSRLDYAGHLLDSTTLPVQEVAERAGFHDASGFCAAFKKHFGLTPTQYKKRPL